MYVEEGSWCNMFRSGMRTNSLVGCCLGVSSLYLPKFWGDGVDDDAGSFSFPTWRDSLAERFPSLEQSGEVGFWCGGSSSGIRFGLSIAVLVR